MPFVFPALWCKEKPKRTAERIAGSSQRHFAGSHDGKSLLSASGAQEVQEKQAEGDGNSLKEKFWCLHQVSAT